MGQHIHGPAFMLLSFEVSSSSIQCGTLLWEPGWALVSSWHQTHPFQVSVTDRGTSNANGPMEARAHATRCWEGRENASLQKQKTEKRREYEKLCVQFVLSVVRNEASRLSCIPKTVIFTGGLVDHNESLFKHVQSQEGIAFLRGPKDAGLLGAAVLACT